MMMQDYEFIFSKALLEKVIEQVRGGVKTWIENVILHVSIRKDESNVRWEWTLDDMEYRINHGLSADDVVWDMLKQYRRFIWNEVVEKEFFKQIF